MRCGVGLPVFRTRKLRLEVDVEPRVVDEVAGMRARMVVDVEHWEEELAELGRVLVLPAVLLDHDLVERPWLERADVTQVA